MPLSGLEEQGGKNHGQKYNPRDYLGEWIYFQFCSASFRMFPI